MRVYWECARRAFARGMAYRTSVFLRIAGNLASILIQVAIWTALLRHGPASGIGLQEMVTYAMISTCLNMLQLTYLFRKVDARLRTGNIAVDLVKPISYPLYLAADTLGETAFQGLFSMLPTLVISGVAFGLLPPASALGFAAFLAAVLITLAISFALGYLIALLAFWFLTTMHFEWTLDGLSKVFAGSFLPLWFFPPWLAAVAGWLPFRYLNFVPVAIYLGRVPVAEVLPTLALGAAWSAALLALTAWIWARSIRRLVVQGG